VVSSGQYEDNLTDVETGYLSVNRWLVIKQKYATWYICLRSFSVPKCIALNFTIEKMKTKAKPSLDLTL
jgi:hypothetical protein